MSGNTPVPTKSGIFTRFAALTTKAREYWRSPIATNSFPQTRRKHAKSSIEKEGQGLGSAPYPESTGRKKRNKMDKRVPDVVAVVKKLKDGAQGSPWIPAGAPPRERYHHFPNGLSICFTLDIFTKVYLNQLAQASGAKIPEELVEGGRFWHLSIARLGARGPTPQEVDFWR